MSNQYLRRVPFYNAPEPPVPQYLHPGSDACSYLSIATPLGDPAVNQVRNPSFETGTDGWALSVLGSTMTRTTEESFSGAFSLRIDAPAGATRYATSYGPQSSVPVVYPVVTVNNNSTLYGKVYVKANVGDRISVRFYQDGVFAVIPPITTTVDSKLANGEWQLFEIEGSTSEVTAVPVQLWIENDNGSGQGVFYVDGALMSSTNVQPFDGDSFEATWEGVPHSSQSNVSQFGSYGPFINLSDIGLDVIAYEGLQLPPVDNIESSFARRHGAHFQRQRWLPRTITVIADLQTCDDRSDIADARKELIDGLTSFKFQETCRLQPILRYQRVDDCCNAMGQAVIMPIVYTGGLEGATSFLWRERITLQLTAYDQVFWQSESTSASERLPVFPNATRPENLGNVAVKPLFIISNGVVPGTLDRIVNSVGGVAIDFQINGAGYTPPPSTTTYLDVEAGIMWRVDNTDPDPDTNTTDVTHLVNHAVSNLNRFWLEPGENNLYIEESGTPASIDARAVWRNTWNAVDSVPVTGVC